MVRAGMAVGRPRNRCRVKPPDFRDRQMVDEMTPDYWFWRVSEGGQVEPYKSMGSAMSAWKQDLSPEDRWAVIAYQHALSGHEGPHVTSEHPEMNTGHGHEGQHDMHDHHGMHDQHGARGHGGEDHSAGTGSPSAAPAEPSHSRR